MQNAIIKYKIRLLKKPNEGKEIEIEINLSELENEWTLSEAIEREEGIEIGGWSYSYYTVIERTIEPFNED